MAVALPSLKTIKSACTAACAVATREFWREQGRGGALYHRPRCLSFDVVTPDGKTAIVNESENREWDGTVRDLQAAIADAEKRGTVVVINISAGLNFSASPRDFIDGVYDAWAAEWEVVLRVTDGVAEIAAPVEA